MRKDKTDSWRMVPQFDFEHYDPDPPFISIIESDDSYLPTMREGDFLSLIFKEDTSQEIAEEIHSLLTKHVAYLQFTGEKRSGFPAGLGEQRKAHNGGKS